jgi:hypothetical protein
MIGTMKTITFVGAMEVPEHGGTLRDTPLVFKIMGKP